MISPKVPRQKIRLGIPSKNKLNTLPEAKPNIKIALEIVAIRQLLVLKIPRIQSDAQAK